MPKPTVLLVGSRRESEIVEQIAGQMRFAEVVTHGPLVSFPAGSSAFETFLQTAQTVDLAVVVLEPSDLAGLPSGNGLFQLGLLLGALGQRRVVIVAAGSHLLVPSDLLGIQIVLWSGPESAADVASAIELQSSEVADRDSRQTYYSCFLSYSAADTAVAHQLHHDLVQVGVRCWLDTKDAKVGDAIEGTIARAIGERDKVLLLLSQSSIQSKWVELEVYHALEIEEAQGITKLFPIAVDEAVFASNFGWAAAIRDERLIADFHDWRNAEAYRASFSRLVRDLSTTAAVDSAR